MRDHTEVINELGRNIALFANTIKPSNKVCSVATGATEPENVSNQELSVPLFSDILKAPAPRLKSTVNRRPQLELGKGALSAAVTHARHGNKTLLIMGDSNTRHVHLGGESVSQTRVPTYLVEDIDPQKCKGFDIVWLHVGINSLKPHNCRDLRGVHEKFDIFMSKIDKIAQISPETRLIISPVLPTAIPALSRRVVIFNRLIFSKRAR